MSIWKNVMNPSSVKTGPAVAFALLVMSGACGSEIALVSPSFDGGASVPSTADAASESDAGADGDGADASADASSDAMTTDAEVPSFDCSNGYVAPVFAPAKTISGCTEIVASGSYTLTQDASTTSMFDDCIHIHDTSNVKLDCGGHWIAGSAGLRISNVTDVEITNCRIAPSGTIFGTMHATNVTRATVHGVKIDGGYCNFNGVQDLRLYDNDLRTVFAQSYAQDSWIACNTASSPSEAPDIASAVIIAKFGVDTRIVANEVDGKWDGTRVGTSHMNGADDGILLVEERNALVHENRVKNNWDCAFESVGSIVDSTITDNIFETSGYCGIGGWYSSSYSGTTIARNTVRRAAQMFAFFRVGGLRDVGWDPRHQFPAETSISFTNNVFEDNVFEDPWDLLGTAAFIPIYDNMAYGGDQGPGETVPTAAQFSLSNNTFRRNTFGPGTTPDFGAGVVVAGRVIDGGGNTCSASSAPGYPLKCN